MPKNISFIKITFSFRGIHLRDKLPERIVEYLVLSFLGYHFQLGIKLWAKKILGKGKFEEKEFRIE